MSEVTPVTFPQQLPVDLAKETRTLFVPADGSVYGDATLQESFRAVDNRYEENRLNYLTAMGRSVLRLDVGVDAAFLQDERTAASRDLLVVMSPLNDGKPESNVGDIYRYATQNGDISRGRAQPNSWGPLTKLSVDYELGAAQGTPMPRLQIFSRDIPALAHAERRQLVSGDMTPFGRLALAGIQRAEQESGQQFDRIHFFGAGMGGKALGAAEAVATRSDYEVGSVTLMNLTMNKDNAGVLLAKYATRSKVGEASDLTVPEDWARIAEPLIRREIDGRGAELGMRVRNVKAMLNVLATTAIVNAKRAPRTIEMLMEHGATVTVANAANEAMVQETSKALPQNDDQFHYMSIVGVEGKKVGMMSNEQAALVATVSNLGIANHLRRTA